MAILTPDRIRMEKTNSGSIISIKEKIIPDSARATKHVATYVPKGAPMKPCKKLNNGTGKPKGITIHNTNDIAVATGTTPAEQYTRATWPNCNMGGAVVHFYVYKSDIWQNLAEAEQGWHATDGGTRRNSHRSGEKIGGNLDTLAIECIGNISESEDTTAKLAAYLLAKYSLDPNTDLYTHNDFYAKKKCPAYILPHWDKFIAKVKQYYTLPANTSQTGSANISDQLNKTNIKIGDNIKFLGGNIYVSSTEKKAATNKEPSVCQVTGIAIGAPHPFHCIGGGIYGWVDSSSIITTGRNVPPVLSVPKTSSAINVGDKVRIRDGVKTFSDGIKMKPLVYNAEILYVRQIGTGARIGQILISTVPTGAVTGWVKSSNVISI